MSTPAPSDDHPTIVRCRRRRRDGRARDVRRDTRPFNGDVGRERVHHGRVYARHPSSAGEPALRAARPCRVAAARRQRSISGQLAGRGQQRSRRRIWFLVVERVVAQSIDRRWVQITGGAVAALLSATAFTVWNQSVVNEKVYTVSLAFFAVVSWLTVRWCDDPDGRRADRILVLIAYLIGLGYANHPAGFLVGPAVAVAVLVRRPRTLLRWRLIAAAILALGFGLTPFALEPIRAAHRPVLNEGDPTGCTGKIGFACTFSDTTVRRLMANINREQYGKPNLSERQAPFTAQLGMWWLYFKWQWLRVIHTGRRACFRVLSPRSSCCSVSEAGMSIGGATARHSGSSVR